jgi:hypothetical protein
MYTPYPWAYGPFTQKPLIHGVEVMIMVQTESPSARTLDCRACGLAQATGHSSLPPVIKKIESPFPHPTIAVGSTVASWPRVHSTVVSCVRGCSNTASCPARLTPPASGHRGRSITLPASPTPPPPRGQPAPRHLDTAAAPSHRPAYPNPSGRLLARFRPFPVAARASSCYLRLSLSTAATSRPSSAMVSTCVDHRATVRALHW